ncbi:glycosyltransferase family 4 protein [Phytohabitans rumicis]|uniref:glycosyltransferase family 4 protein n=1 Tax=Phytohabitans rumicis TaxID=1076125 RepID=UPI0031E876FA
MISETFIRWDTRELLPGGTAIVADPPPRGESVLHGQAWDAGECPVLAFDPLPGDPPPSAERLNAVADFLATHSVEAVLVEYLDFADRWFDFLLRQSVRVWLRGHGVDFSARLTEQRWRDAYRRYELAAGIIVPSAVAADALTTLGLPAEKIHVVRYSVELPRPRPATTRDRSPDVRCVAVGRLVPKKAPLLLLEAFRDAASRHQNVVLDLVGDGPLMGEVRQYVDEHELTDRVHVHGRLPHSDTLALIRGADILLHHAVTSPQDGDTEGQPLAILEAMAAGLPVIATNHAGIPEAITDKVNGRLVAEHDVRAMTANLLELADDHAEQQRLGRAARKTIKERHGPDHARQVLLTLLGLAEAGTTARARAR